MPSRKKAIRQLQLVQKDAARVLTKTKKRDHDAAALRCLHCQRVEFFLPFLLILLPFNVI